MYWRLKALLLRMLELPEARPGCQYQSVYQMKAQKDILLVEVSR